MALFGHKKNDDGLSDWAKIRDEHKDGFAVIAGMWSAIKDRWNEGFEGKANILIMTIVVFFALVVVSMLLGNYFPTFDPSR
jgi:hypothetical protein